MTHEPDRFRLIVAGLVVVLAFTTYAHGVSMLGTDGLRFLPPFQPNVVQGSLKHLGNENFKIGYRVAQGQGFADPFGVGSGPTAWMPPVYPVLCAVLVLVFGKDVDAIGTVMGGAQVIGLMVVWCLLVGTVRPRSRAGGVALLAIFIVFLLTHFHYSFLFTHDYFVAILGMACIIRFAPAVSPPETWRGWCRWGIVGGMSTLAAPALAAPWLLLSATACRRDQKGLLVALGTIAIVLAPWTIRNAIVFGKFIPVKSNAPYEVYQSLEYTEDGVATPSTFRNHPGNIGPEMYEYRELGESAYLLKKSDQVRDLLVDDPGRYLNHCAYRAFAIVVWNVPFFAESELAVPRWFCRLTYPLPLIGAMIIVIRRWWRFDPAAGVALLAFVGFAIPYILLSYYDRYEYAFGPAKMLLTYYGLKALIARRPSRYLEPGLSAPPTPSAALGPPANQTEK